MLQRKSALLCMTLAALGLLFLAVCTPCAAMNIEVTDGTLPDSQDEAVTITYTIVITGLPVQAEYLEISTDLIPVSDSTLWTVPDTTYVEIEGGEDSLNDQKITLKILEYPDQGITVTCSGRVPSLTSVETVDGVVITKRVEQSTGYIYYHVRALDENNDLLGTAATETFSITIPGEDVFKERLNAVSDTDMRAIIDDLYSKGLTDEAGDLLDYWEAPKESTVSLTMTAIAAIVLMIIGLVVGVIFGQIRARNMQDFEDDYRGR